MKDLWTGKEISVNGSITAEIPFLQMAVFRVSSIDTVKPTGMIFNVVFLKCLTASGSLVEWAKCAASDELVWQVTSDGSTINSISDSTICLTRKDGGDTPAACEA